MTTRNVLLQIVGSVEKDPSPRMVINDRFVPQKSEMKSPVVAITTALGHPKHVDWQMTTNRSLLFLFFVLRNSDSNLLFVSSHSVLVVVPVDVSYEELR